jgi:predicted transcriptional regulator
MAKQSLSATAVHVSLDPSWLRAVDKCARKLRYTREQFILAACQQFIGQIDVRELERIYCERLRPQAEDLAWAEAGAALAGEILPQEEW